MLRGSRTCRFGDRVRDISVRAAPRRDPRTGRARRLRADRARADDLRHHPCEFGHDHARRQQPVVDRFAAPGPPGSASPTCPRTAACRAGARPMSDRVRLRLDGVTPRGIARGIFLDLRAEAVQGPRPRSASSASRARGPAQVGRAALRRQPAESRARQVARARGRASCSWTSRRAEWTSGPERDPCADGSARRRGVAILMISCELPEVLGMSDRVLVLHGGRLVADHRPGRGHPETVGAAMAGASREEAAA